MLVTHTDPVAVTAYPGSIILILILAISIAFPAIVIATCGVRSAEMLRLGVQACASSPTSQPKRTVS